MLEAWLFACSRVREIALSCLDTQWGFRDNTPVEAGGEFAYAGILIEELCMSQSQPLNHSHGASIQTLDTIQLCLLPSTAKEGPMKHCCKHNTCLISL
jgi:hypothetical protein